MSRLWTPRRASLARADIQRPGARIVLDNRPLRPTKLHSVYGDDFDADALDPKWSVAGATLTQDGISWAALTATAGQYCYQDAPSGDFTLSGACIYLGAISNMAGLLIVDSSGNGIGVTPYDSPNEFIILNLSGGSYGGSFHQVGSAAGNPGQVGALLHLKLIKSGTSYVAQVGSADWKTWSASSSSMSGPSTAARIGFGKFFGSSGSMRLDWIDLA